jgi:hypothetical protein
LGLLQIFGIAQVCPLEFRARESGALPIGGIEIGAGEIDVLQSGISQIGLGQNCASENWFLQNGLREIRLFEVRVVEVCPLQMRGLQCQLPPATDKPSHWLGGGNGPRPGPIADTASATRADIVAWLRLSFFDIQEGIMNFAGGQLVRFCPSVNDRAWNGTPRRASGSRLISPALRAVLSLASLALGFSATETSISSAQEPERTSVVHTSAGDVQGLVARASVNSSGYLTLHRPLANSAGTRPERQFLGLKRCKPQSLQTPVRNRSVAFSRHRATPKTASI